MFTRLQSLFAACLFAASLATSFIGMGVKAVVAAGWAVNDGAAKAFATRFYESFLTGSSFGEAVSAARKAAHDAVPGCNTWAAYQCYGDPDWRLRWTPGDAQAPSAPLALALAHVASLPGLILALRTLAVRAKYHHERDEAAQGALRALERRFDAAWGQHGELCEAFGNVWLAMGDRQAAAAWFERAIAADDGAATFKAAENLYNLRARAAFDALQGKLQGFDKPSAALTPEQSRQLRASAASASMAIEAVVEALSRLSALSETAERANLCGSACKRLSMVHRAAEEHEQAAACITRMRGYYACGWQLSKGKAHVDAFYSAMNVLAAAVASGDAWDPQLAEQVRALVRQHYLAAPDFWNVTASVEIAAWEALALSRLEQRSATLEASLADVHDRVSDPSMWSSVLDQTRFVVTARSHRCPPSPAEQAAVDGLLAVLSAYAQCPAPEPRR